ncbi:hypothetical protein CYMTET_51850 [Cymbomonas tetramitiformis]|uniref:Uncharacterized protein n=1 Tax=Cymbomonas tetramitiformis TaxID=36881 RepID=A0AAE0BLL7_9CHLO|nr:hypothetical protein CYMTET_51850 [Cymbomonas tetramitiformis]
MRRCTSSRVSNANWHLTEKELLLAAAVHTHLGPLSALHWPNLQGVALVLEVQQAQAKAGTPLRVLSALAGGASVGCSDNASVGATSSVLGGGTHPNVASTEEIAGQLQGAFRQLHGALASPELRGAADGTDTAGRGGDTAGDTAGTGERAAKTDGTAVTSGDKLGEPETTDGRAGAPDDKLADPAGRSEHTDTTGCAE